MEPQSKNGLLRSFRSLAQTLRAFVAGNDGIQFKHSIAISPRVSREFC
jgi:hypothetical protein